MQKIRKGDKVVILTGKDKGRSGEVLQVMPKEDRALVRGINVVKRGMSGTQVSGLGNVALDDLDGEHAVARLATVLRPDPGLVAPHQVETLLGLSVTAVRSRLRVRERRVQALDPSGLALQVAGCAVVSGVVAGGNSYGLAGEVRHEASLSSSSPGASTPFSVRIVSTEKSQRS